MQKLVCICGNILFPLQSGKRAIIVKGVDCIYTSRVVEIWNETDDMAYFETMNSVYKVSLSPVPMKAPLPFELSMCA